MEEMIAVGGDNAHAFELIIADKTFPILGCHAMCKMACGVFF
jgi:hypothetical protein